MKERTALGEAILKHWREHCPQMVADLQKRRGLNRAVFEAQERTGDLLYELTVVKKMDYQAAWELAMEEWALPDHSQVASRQKSEKKKSEKPAAKGAKRRTAKAKARKAKIEAQQSGPSKSKAPRRNKRPRSRRGTSE